MVKNKEMQKHYVVYSAKISLEADSAHEIHDVMCANAVANLDRSAVLVYPDLRQRDFDFSAFLHPFNCREPDKDFIEFYNVQKKLKVAPLPIPQNWEKLGKKWQIFSRLIYQYYLPFHVFPKTKTIHTRDWNCVKAAVRDRVPVIYEKHYFQKVPYEPKIVNSPCFKIAITQSEPIRQSLIEAGMPPEKVIWLHNGFSPAFLVRQPKEAAVWRQELLKDGRQYLAVYSGALYRFKGIDMLIDVAQQLPDIQFAITGGSEEQVNSYRQLAQDKQVENIQFLGWILPRSRLISLLQAADVLAHPHCSGEAANFTNPVKFFQYMASGTPITATEIPPLIPFKSAKIATAWCQPDNPREFAQCLEYVLQTYPRKQEGYTENSNFSQQFTWEERALKIMNYEL
jgi:glycosyltransferase involved in cell wall biosynthesis